MINNLVGYTAVVLEDVEIGCTGCEGDLLSDGLFLEFHLLVPGLSRLWMKIYVPEVMVPSHRRCMSGEGRDD